MIWPVPPAYECFPSTLLAMTWLTPCSICRQPSELTCLFSARRSAARWLDCFAVTWSLKLPNICPTPFSCSSTAESGSFCSQSALILSNLHQERGRMTNDILQSDIDLARRLLDARRPADEIVAALSYRGINGNRAAHLVADFHAGKAVEPDKHITI